jgi:signal transduction histidine kinase
LEQGEVRSATRVYHFANYFLDRGHLLFIEDVTDRKRYESIAAHADMANNTALLVSSLRHELGNPVNSLKMALSVLGENMEEFDEQRRHRYVDRCLQQVRALEELLGHLRSFHAMGVFTPQLERLDIFFQEHCEFLRGVVKGCGVELRVVPCDTPVTVLAHRRALQQALSNITTNAIEAMEGRPDACLELEVAQDAGYVFIEVRDNGPGIDSNSLRDVFTPLFSTKEHGTGLGLAIVRNLMMGMKGDVELESELGRGTTVRLVLQRAEPAQAEQRNMVCPRVLAPL